MAISDSKSNTDFELNLFIQNLYHEVQSLTYSDDEGDSKENKFTEYVMDILADAGETEGVRLCPYIKENKYENIQFKINGYALEEGYENIDIFISHYIDTNELYRVSKVDFDKLIKWSTGFVNAGLKGYLDEIEPSSEAYGLAKILSQQRKEIIRVRIYLLSNGEIPHDTPKDFRLKSLEEILVRFEVWDIERLHRLAQSKGNREPIEIDFEEMMNTSIPCLEMPVKNELYECYLAIVPGLILSTLYQNYGTRLLESNVRAFLQQTGKVNQGIRDTIRREPQMFLTYNNGLATTAQEVKTKMSDNGHLVITSIKDFQIVNGGQTTASLFHTSRKYKEADISNVFVQMKLTVIKDEEKKNETVPLISRYANSQNKVTELDLSSNNLFLQRLEELSRTTYAINTEDHSKQTIWFFERVSGQYKEALNKEPTKSKQEAFKFKFPKNQVLIKSDVAKYVNIWKQQPYHVSKGSQKNYINFLREIDKEYKNKKVNRVYWEDVVANAILFQGTDKLFGRKNKDAIGDTNIKSHTVGYALSYFHYVTENKLDLGEIWKNQMIEDDLLFELKKLIVSVYNFFTDLDVALISEAAKSEKTWNKLKEEIRNPMNMKIVEKYFISEDRYKSRYESNIDEIKEAAQYNSLQIIAEQGLRFWDGLCLYMLKQECLSSVQQNYVYTIRKKLKWDGELTPNEIEKGKQIVELLSSKGVDFDDIRKLSKLNDELSDPSIIYNRIKLIDNDTWKRVIAIGEQTGKLNDNEISVIKVAVERLKKQETIDLSRLTIVNAALDKVRKYGLSV
ncbi:AIPR protein [Bacteroides luti]|uniref:AIPR protein n=1 Tax=Bacteroides luti TaxID=1297750 RepID=A0A1M4XZZ7_9BACE|nr:AIPR family protein [Bacteroides luti]SHE98893.1 AIPR protein [Bacteroides luti]